MIISTIAVLNYNMKNYVGWKKCFRPFHMRFQLVRPKSSRTKHQKRTMFNLKYLVVFVTISVCGGVDHARVTRDNSINHHEFKNVTRFLNREAYGFRHRRVITSYPETNRTRRHLLSLLFKIQEADCGFKCKDGTCIKSYMKCDGRIQCPDVSDELDCKCTDRIGSKKICDGYEDCPLGEDEIGCGLGCAADEFSCSDRKGVSSSSCVKILKRCDGHQDCPGNEDEKGCFRLTGFDPMIRGVISIGALQKRIGDQWYTICKSTGKSESRYLKKYARKACEHIVGHVDEDPQTSSISTSHYAYFELIYAKFGESETSITALTTCSSAHIYKVECPEPQCGWPASKFEHKSSHHISRSTNAAFESTRYKRHAMSKGLTAKIVGGYDSEHGTFPFIVGIYRNGSFHCGGSIVNKDFIITAAHCCHGYDKYVYEIQVGMMRRNSWSPYEQTRIVSEIHVHERYDSKIFLNDIAIMKVDFSFYMSKWVTPACLATEKSQDPGVDKSCKVIGWGDTSEDGDGPDHLQEVDLPILAKCQETFTKDSHQICAGVMEGGKDACQGDSGGPLICSNHEGRPYLHGLVSFGRGCARPNQAGVYTRVTAYKSWIESIITGEHPTMKLHQRPKECSASTKCFRDGGECIFSKFYCDQEVQCLDLNDEKACQYVGRAGADDDDEPGEDAYEHVRSTSHDTQEHTHEYGSAKLCSDTEFQCKTTLSCIPLEVKCDGKYDCTDKTDEKQCECGEIIQNAFPYNKCDGIHHCLDGTDELDCERCNGTEGMVKCPFSERCIREAHVCDGTSHCDFGEDEIDCIRITKTKGTIPTEGFLSDKLSRGLRYGYVVIRSAGITWSLACVEDFGTSLKDIVCPYLGLATPESSGTTRRARKAGSFDPDEFVGHHRASRGTDTCEQVKVQCGESGCGESKLFSMSQTAPEPYQLGALPWLCVVLVEGNPVCAATLVHKQWLLVNTECIDDNVRSTSNEYLSAVAGFSKTTNVVASPMEHTKRIDAINKLGGEDDGLTLLRLESPFMTDHFVNPICTYVRPELETTTCVRVSVINGTEIKSWPVVTDPSCEEEYLTCIKGDGMNCENTGGSFVYCTRDGSWFLLGYVDPIGSDKKCLDKDKMELINPFYGEKGQETTELLTRPPLYLIKAPGCSGTRCTYGNCVGKSFVCDGIAHCPDYLDEKRCQRHYQVLRTHDDEDEVSYESGISSNITKEIPVGHFRCGTTGNFVPISAFCDGIYDCGEDDFTDEPLNEKDCSCRHYLELSAPERVCDADGIENCPDRGDEHGCPCRSDSFVCDSSSYKIPAECIHINLVCDSVKDCSNGRDEEMCTTVSTSLTNVRVEAKQNSVEGYVLVRVKGTWYPYCSDQWSGQFGQKICNFLGYKNLVKIQTIELEQLESKRSTPSLGYGIIEDHIGGQQTLWILGGGEELSMAGPIEDFVSETNYQEDYQCHLGYISCSQNFL